MAAEIDFSFLLLPALFVQLIPISYFLCFEIKIQRWVSQVVLRSIFFWRNLNIADSHQAFFNSNTFRFDPLLTNKILHFDRLFVCSSAPSLNCYPKVNLASRSTVKSLRIKNPKTASKCSFTGSIIPCCPFQVESQMPSTEIFFEISNHLSAVIFSQN